MKQKKTISELYEECKKEQETEQQLGNLMVIAEMFKSQLAPILSMPQSFQLAQLNNINIKYKEK